MRIAFSDCKAGWKNKIGEGIAAAGHTPVLIDERKTAKINTCDFIIQICYNYQLKPIRVKCVNAAHKYNIPIVFIDRGIFKSHTNYWSVCINAAKNKGIGYTNKYIHNSDRLTKLNLDFNFWNIRTGPPAILMHNINGYAKIKSTNSYQEKELSKTIELLESKYEEVLKCYHPSDRRKGKDLNYVLEHAQFCVGWHTNALCDAVLNGIPIVCLDDNCLAFDISSHHIDDPIFTPDRTGWLNRMSWCHWGDDEIKSGEFFNFIKEHI